MVQNMMFNLASRRDFKMKRIILITISAVLLISALSFYASAHAGKTDGSGGHYDRSTGEYHYHHGYSAHQHTNGECPYDFDDRTDHSSGSDTKKESSSVVTKKRNSSSDIGDKIGIWILSAMGTFYLSFIIFGFMSSILPDNNKLFAVIFGFIIALSLIVPTIIVYNM